MPGKQQGCGTGEVCTSCKASGSMCDIQTYPELGACYLIAPAGRSNIQPSQSTG